MAHEVRCKAGGEASSNLFAAVSLGCPRYHRYPWSRSRLATHGVVAFLQVVSIASEEWSVGCPLSGRVATAVDRRASAHLGCPNNPWIYLRPLAR